MKNILITGGSGEIGSEIILHLSFGNNKIFFTYNKNYKSAQNIYKKIKKKNNNIFFYKVSNNNQNEIINTIKKIKKNHGSIDILINNAGRSQIKNFTKISKADLDLMIDVNLKGTFFWCQQVIKDMIKNKYGRIINIASIGGQWGGTEQIHYAISKAGIICLTKSLAKTFSKNGICTNCISPGLIDTKMIKKKNLLKNAKFIPSKRIGKTYDLLSAIDFLIDKRSSYVTGQTINVNGGMFFS